MSAAASAFSGAILRELDRLQWPQAELARRMSLSNAHLSHLLRGGRRWHLEQMVAAANALGVELAFLLGPAPSSALLANRVYVDLAAGETKRFREISADELRSPSNMLHVLVRDFLKERAMKDEEPV